MGSEMALARLGVATCMIFSPFVPKFGGALLPSRRPLCFFSGQSFR